MHTFTKQKSAQTAILWAALVAVGAAAPSVHAVESVLSKDNLGVSVEESLVPLCGLRTDGDPDGIPQSLGDPDAKGKQQLRLSKKALTTPTQADLAIVHVNGTFAAKDYSLKYCIANRGGKSAYAPIAVSVRADGTTMQELTIFKTIPSLGAICVGNANPTTVPAGKSLVGATIQVASPTGETAMSNNKCRIQWNKK